MGEVRLSYLHPQLLQTLSHILEPSNMYSQNIVLVHSSNCDKRPPFFMSVGIEGVHWVHHLSSTSIRAARNDSNAPTTTGIASKPANLVTVRDIGLTASTKMD